MAGMKRFVTYIYAYEEEKKGSNVGFARIEIRGQDARIEIHLRGVYAASAACRVYLFQREASGGKEATGVTGVLVGEMKLANGSGDGIVVLKGGRVGASPYGITEMEGLFFVIGEERILMSRWREGAPFKVGLSGFREWQPEETKEKTAEKGLAAETAAQNEVREAAAVQPEQNSRMAVKGMAQGKQGEAAAAQPEQKEQNRHRMCRPDPEWRWQRRGRRWRRFMPLSFPCAICSRNTTGMPCGRSSAENISRWLCLRSGICSASSWN